MTTEELQMSAETYKHVMSFDHYPEPATGERQVKLDLHVKAPFSRMSDDSAVCLLPWFMSSRTEKVRGVGFSEGSHYGEKSKPRPSKAVSRAPWRTQFTRTRNTAQWKERDDELRKKEAASVSGTVSPEVPHVCVMCKDTYPSKKSCKLSGQGMASLCSLHNKRRGLIILPANKRALRECPYKGSLRQKLNEFEKRNRPAKVWRVSMLPTFNRNDGEFVRMGTDDDTGDPIRKYRDSNPRLVPEVAFSHDRTESNSGYDECAFPDDWRMDLAEAGGGDDDHMFMDTPDSDVKKQCAEIPKPVWVSVTRTYFDPQRCIITGFQTCYTQDKRTELNRVWHWDAEKRRFTFTVEEREEAVPVRHDFVVRRFEEYPTLINVQSEEMLAKEIKHMSKLTGKSKAGLRAEIPTILVQSSTVVTKKERRYYSAKRERERQKQRLTGYLVPKGAEGAATSPPKHKWPDHSKKVVAPIEEAIV